MARVRTETTAAVRRIVSRGLLVFGGVVAGTAAAWLLSSATASADTQPGHGLGSVQLPTSGAFDDPVAHNVNKAVKDAGGVVDSTVHSVTTARSAAPVDLSTVVADVDETLHGRDADASGIGGLGDKAKAAFDKVGADLAAKFGWPRSGDLADVPGDQAAPPVAGMPGDTSPIVGPVAHPSSASGPRVATDGFTAPALQDRSRMGGLNRGSPRSPALPDPLRMPVSPLPAPGGSGGHSSSAGAPDGPAFGAVPSTGFRTVLAVIGTSRPAIAGAPVHTGAQPGSTPD